MMNPGGGAQIWIEPPDPFSCHARGRAGRVRHRRTGSALVVPAAWTGPLESSSATFLLTGAADRLT
jgi:hypothetical protein